MASFKAVLRVMAADASTPSAGQAKMAQRRIRTNERTATPTMIRIFLIVILAGLIALGVAVLMLGEYPPNPTPHPVEKVLPNDKFQSH